MIQISTSDVDFSRRVYIEDKDFGGEYTVRPLGAGEELQLSQIVRRIGQIQAKENAGNLTDEDEAELLELAEKTFQITTKLYDDGEGGVKARGLIDKLSSKGLLQLHNKIFNTEDLTSGEGESAETKAAAQTS